MSEPRPIRFGEALAIGLVAVAVVATAIALVPTEELLPAATTLQALALLAGTTTLATLVLVVVAAVSSTPESDPPRRERIRVAAFRALGLGTLAIGGWYAVWRVGGSLNPDALWLAILLVIAEAYALVDTVLLIIMMWRPTWRTAPPPLRDASVDVFVTTVNEPVDLVRLTVAAATRISWPLLSVYILDDGSRPEMAELARTLGCGLITRGEEWTGKPRHAKAGNVNNALLQTSGDFILVLDADQIPSPEIIEKTIGYFRDDKVAFVQTPQRFYNLPPGDPFGSDAPLFYGPILRGKDGWNAAFFCGSNAVLRREALLQLGLNRYVEETEERIAEGMARLRATLRRAFRKERGRDPALQELDTRLRAAEEARRRGDSLQAVVSRVQTAITEYRRLQEQSGLRELDAALGELEKSGDAQAAETRDHLEKNIGDLSIAIARMEDDAFSAGLRDLDLDARDEAIPINALSTTSVTEDMATSVGLHALGWKSVYHGHTLAHGLAPEDLGAAIVQRKRWAQGTMQVLFRERPLSRPGLSLGQRLQYFTTIYSYFSGFASVIFLAMPIVFLFTGIPPVRAFSAEFLWRLVPYLVLNRLLFKIFALGTRTRRGEQYSLGLFPVWITAVFGAIFNRRLRFVVTPKVRASGTFLRMVKVQIATILLSAAAVVFALYRLASGTEPDFAGVLVNVFWAVYNIVLLSTIVRAAVYRPPVGFRPLPPAGLGETAGTGA